MADNVPLSGNNNSNFYVGSSSNYVSSCDGQFDGQPAANKSLNPVKAKNITQALKAIWQQVRFTFKSL